MIVISKQIVGFLDKFRAKKFEIYVVGGAVRNLLLKKEVTNWDFTTSAEPEQILKLFPDAFYNNTYGTVSVPVKDYIFEVTPYRREGKYEDFRHPNDVVWAKTIEEDLGRRDFTINAMAYDAKTIVDPHNGQVDLNNKSIRAVGNPDKRFCEDALRLIRAVRFASQLGFMIQEKTRAA